LISQYKQTLKNPFAEELIDLFFFRPVAFLFVKILVLFPVTPNQISFAAMFFGIAAGVSLSHGSPLWFVVGGTLYGIANILDCCDGMLARLKKNGTSTGRIVDGLVDYINGIAVYTGLGMGLTKAVGASILHLPCNPWILVAVAGASNVFHAIATDYYRNTFLNQQKNAAADGGAENELDKTKAELIRLNAMQGHRFDKMLLSLYCGYLGLQKNFDKKDNTKIVKKVMPRIRPATVVLWNLIGPSTHISFFIAGVILFSPMVFFAYVIGFANIWMLVLPVAGLFLNRQNENSAKTL
jgi:hypothetical protein